MTLYNMQQILAPALRHTIVISQDMWMQKPQFGILPVRARGDAVSLVKRLDQRDSLKKRHMNARLRKQQKKPPMLDLNLYPCQSGTANSVGSRGLLGLDPEVSPWRPQDIPPGRRE
jgi:hypothetical protein